ncbi:uncharacterized protein [Cicer arietinum]|uniref:uncharacterized protein n=1 Tax=Cicer arietinum TaxID=3827 RepID=UPI003CC54F10
MGNSAVGSKATCHPALTVTNIKNHIPIVLELENIQFGTWVELFKIHARSHKVLHHIIPPAPRMETTAPATDDEKELWTTLDATILQWIYSTISSDLLATIIEPDSTAMEAWNRLTNIFQNNQNARAVTLEQEFSSIRMEDFPIASAYCQRLKMISDQLKNIGAPVSNQRLVLQLISGLTDAYKGVGTLIRQSNPLPQFYQARSMLTLEEASLIKMAATGAQAAMIAAQPKDLTEASYSTDNRDNKKNSNRNSANKNRGSYDRNGGRGHRGGGRGVGQPSQQTNTSPWSSPPAPWQQYPWGWMSPPWALPPCPYPSSQWTRPNGPPKQQGLLGPHPQAYAASTPSLAPTNIEAAMHTMSLNPPDGQWYMDIGATSHMTASQGNLSSYSNMSNSNQHIIVGSGQQIPIRGYGHSTLSTPTKPLKLQNVLHAPQIIKNLIYVRRLTTDNNVSIAFDPFGFSCHPALTVTNIKNHIPIVLELENFQFGTWVELFKIHARSHKVLHHIIPPAPRMETTAPATDDEKELWTTLDATILQWIYSTISSDLLATIIEPDSTAMEAWNRLTNIFQNNQNARAVTLEQEFSSIRMEDFPIASAYCQRLKMISDQLKNIGAPVSNQRLVLQLISGLTDAYKGVGTLIRQSNPLPQFYQARSMLTLEEASLIKMAATGAQAAMIAAQPKDLTEASYSTDNRDNKKNSNRNSANKNRGSYDRNGGRGHRGGGRGVGQPSQQTNTSPWSSPPAPWQQYPWGWMSPPWALPPCPYPSSQWTRPNGPPKQQGLLGPHPQAYAASTPSLAPTNIEAAMHTMSLNPPDGQWYMDIGATSHMTASQDGDATNEM